MADNFFEELKSFIKKLNMEIEYQKIIRDKADDLDDWEKGQEITLKSSRNIRQLKSWQTTLSNLLSEMSNSDLFADKETNLESNSNELTKTPKESEEDTPNSYHQHKVEESVNESTDKNDWVASVSQIYNEITGSGDTDTESVEKEFNEEYDSSVWYTVEDDFSNEKICRFMLFNKQYDVRNLTEALVKICELLYDHDKELFYRFMYSAQSRSGNRKILSHTPQASPESTPERNYNRKLANSSNYVWVNNNNTQKIIFISQMLEFYNIDRDQLKFTLTDNCNEEQHVNLCVEEPTPLAETSMSPIRELIPFTLLGNSYRVENSSEFMVRLCVTVMVHKPYPMMLAAVNLPQYFTDDPNDKRFSLLQRLPNNLYVETFKDLKTSIAVAREILSYCDIPENELKIGAV